MLWWLDVRAFKTQFGACGKGWIHGGTLHPLFTLECFVQVQCRECCRGQAAKQLNERTVRHRSWVMKGNREKAGLFEWEIRSQQEDSTHCDKFYEARTGKLSH
jgi:hypothetical protein